MGSVGDAIGDLALAPLKLLGDALTPDMPSIPDPGAVPDADEALLRRRLRSRRGLETLQIDPAARGTGLQIPPT